MSDIMPVENSHVTEQTVEDSRPDPKCVSSGIEAIDSNQVSEAILLELNSNEPSNCTCRRAFEHPFKL